MYINYEYIRLIPTYLHNSVYNLFEMTKIQVLIKPNFAFSLLNFNSMKKLFVTLFVMCAIVGATMAQPRAIGARVGYNLEFSYQHSLGERMMMDLTAGATNVWNGWAYADVNAMFDWVFNINGGWNWYVGPGAGIGFGFGHWWKDYGYIPVRLNVGAQIGVEYQFDIPLNLSVDWRPMVNVLGFLPGEHGVKYPLYYSFAGVALGVRYRF